MDTVTAKLRFDWRATDAPVQVLPQLKWGVGWSGRLSLHDCWAESHRCHLSELVPLLLLVKRQAAHLSATAQPPRDLFLGDSISAPGPRGRVAWKDSCAVKPLRQRGSMLDMVFKGEGRGYRVSAVRRGEEDPMIFSHTSEVLPSD